MFFVALIHENTFVCYCVRLVLLSVIFSPGCKHTLAYQFCFPKLRNIEYCAKDNCRHHIASHPPANASAQGAVAVLVRAAHTAKSEYKAVKNRNICFIIPFISNDNGEEDGTVEDDVIHRKQKLGENNGVQFTIVGKRPPEH